MTEQAYIQALRSVYLQLPNTHRRFSRSDRRLASNLFQRSFSLELVRSALLLASARRLARNPTARALGLHRSTVPQLQTAFPAVPTPQSEAETRPSAELKKSILLGFELTLSLLVFLRWRVFTCLSCAGSSVLLRTSWPVWRGVCSVCIAA